MILNGKDKLHEFMSKVKKGELDMKVHSAIQLSLADVVLREVVYEETTACLWQRLESLYTSKSLTNKLYLK